MKKILLSIIVILFTAMSLGFTPVLAEDDHHRREGRHRKHDEHHEEGSHHHGKKYRKKNNHEIEILGLTLLFMALNDREQRKETEKIVERTSETLIRAQRMAQEKNYCVGLGEALAHQEKARQLLRNGKYTKAINHTLWARATALHFMDYIMEGDFDEESAWGFCDFRECDLVYTEMTDKEARFMQNAPSPVEMREAIRGMEISDEKALEAIINTDI